MRMWCKHKWGKVDEGFQYCEHCGKATAPPPRECPHEWEEDNSFNVTNGAGNKTKIIYLSKCKKCGDKKIIEIKV